MEDEEELYDFEAEEFSALWHNFSPETRNLIRIRSGLYDDRTLFPTSTWLNFRASVHTWMKNNPWFYWERHENHQPDLERLEIIMKNGDDHLERRTRIMSLVMIIFEDIESSPFKSIYDIVNSGAHLRIHDRGQDRIE